jgi:hypothetical protein
MRLFHRSSIGAALVLAVTLALGTSATGGAVGPTRVLRTAPDDVVVRVGDIARWGRAVAVAWDEKGPRGVRSFARWRLPGEAFGPIRALGGGRQASDPRIALCGGFIYAVGTWPRKGGSRVGLDYTYLEGADRTPIGEGHFALGRGSRPDVACSGVTAAAWFGEDRRVKVHVRLFTDMDWCPDGCRFWFDGDLGPGNPADGVSITTWRRGFILAWKSGSRLIVRRIVAGTNMKVGLVVKPQPRLTVLDTPAARFPLLARDGPKMVLAYKWRGGVRIMSSGDAGRSFGLPRVVVRAPCEGCDSLPRPLSVDVSGNSILVEVLSTVGTPPVRRSAGFLSRDDGTTWGMTSAARNARKVGVLHRDGVAEAWDKQYIDGRRLRFHAGPMP